MGTQSPKVASSSRKTARVKKPYAEPVLVAWGTLRDMTKHVGKAGKADGGKAKNMTKTR
jgi:hypothetical protein